jgi:isocitrate lyase
MNLVFLYRALFVGPDLADYPMDTVPNKVEHLFLAQCFHDRKQYQARMSLPKAERAKLGPAIDFLRPIVADADTGHGGITANMKLTKMFVERGAAGVHIEDQVIHALLTLSKGCRYQEMWSYGWQGFSTDFRANQSPSCSSFAM